MNRLFPAEFSRLCGLLVGGSLAFLSGLTSEVSAIGAETSRLWGLTGERWEADGRLPDYSYAGYHRGERPLPERRADVSVKDFGAFIEILPGRDGLCHTFDATVAGAACRAHTTNSPAHC